jgi:hypothetical protein
MHGMGAAGREQGAAARRSIGGIGRENSVVGLSHGQRRSVRLDSPLKQ